MAEPDRKGDTVTDFRYTCEDCGTCVDLYVYPEGCFCAGCRGAWVDGQVLKFDGNTQHTDEIVCPHCGHEHSDSWEMSAGEEVCERCERVFRISRDVEITYSTVKEDKNAAP